ncbi:GLIPR1-like protein 1 isoform X2 [Ptychodera flava]|uniref:GLIPR1-like protein 1 isoform X1 n=1 Tax=Ptychodera flava TaxID=63121 RepID=UPI00396A37C5
MTSGMHSRILLLLAVTTLSLISADNEPRVEKSNKSFFNVRRQENGEGSSLGRAKRSSDFTSNEISTMLARHNYHRTNVNPTAANMKYMSWDDDLAAMAQKWSEECTWAHGFPPNISPFPIVGQNLWLGGPYSPSDWIDVEGVVDSWQSEVSDYNFDSNTCSKVCGHYTQVVWASSYAVGCGIAHCPTVTSSRTVNAFLVTCNYGPAGNYPRRPYTSGTPCSQCDVELDSCRENQCSENHSTTNRYQDSGTIPMGRAPSFLLAVLLLSADAAAVFGIS